MSELVWVCNQTRDFHGIPNARASRPKENFPSGSAPFPTCPSPPQPASVIGSSVIVSRAPNGILSGISVTGLLICSLSRQRAPDKECGVCAVRQKSSPVAIHHSVKHHCRQPASSPIRLGIFCPRITKNGPSWRGLCPTLCLPYRWMNLVPPPSCLPSISLESGAASVGLEASKHHCGFTKP